MPSLPSENTSAQDDYEKHLEKLWAAHYQAIEDWRTRIRIVPHDQAEPDVIALTGTEVPRG